MTDSEDKIAKAAEKAAEKVAERTGRDWSRAIPFALVLTTVFAAGGAWVTVDAVKRGLADMSGMVKDYIRTTDARIRSLEEFRIREESQRPSVQDEATRGGRRRSRQ